MKNISKIMRVAAILASVAFLSLFVLGVAYLYEAEPAAPMPPAPEQEEQAAETEPLPVNTDTPENDREETGQEQKEELSKEEEQESLPQAPALPEEKTPAPENAKLLTVLVYHHLAPESLGLHKNNPMYLPVELFRRHMEYLKKHNYYTPTLAEVEAFLAGRGELPEKSVLITFDDGYESNYHYAHPILNELGLRAVNFVIGESTRAHDLGHTFDPAVSTHLSPGQLAEMVESGTWEIGSHTYGGHVKIAGIPALEAWDTGQITEDFLKINETLLTAGLPRPMAVAYPYGAHDEEVLAASRQVGYRLGFTVVESYAKPGTGPLLVPRFGVFPWTSTERLAAILQKAL